MTSALLGGLNSPAPIHMQQHTVLCVAQRASTKSAKYKGQALFQQLEAGTHTVSARTVSFSEARLVQGFHASYTKLLRIMCSCHQGTHPCRTIQCAPVETCKAVLMQGRAHARV